MVSVFDFPVRVMEMSEAEPGDQISPSEALSFMEESHRGGSFERRM
jgi:hypothetical protein